MILCVLLDGSAGADEGVADQAAGTGTGAADDADGMVGALLASAPRVTLETTRAWLDVRGLHVGGVHETLRSSLGVAGAAARFGAGTRPVVAEAAAYGAAAGELVEVPVGGERAFLQPLELSALGVPDPLLGWLADVGIERCGELAAVSREAVEVRFGAAAVQWWRWSRGDDDRRLFAPVLPERPHASIDFIDYVVTDPERLVFTTNALLGGLCEQMVERGAHARRLRLRLPLANGTVWERTLKTARPTADRSAWLRLARALLERLTVPDSVAGVSVEVEATEAAAAVQGDLFDSGFATVGAVESALARLVEDQGGIVRAPTVTSHPLVERRSDYAPLSIREALAAPTSPVETTEAVPSADEPVGLTLQLLDEPRRIHVETARRRDHQVPVRYRDGRWHALVNAAGPDRVSGGQWDSGYAREYFRAVTVDGSLVWLFRDASCDRWYLHGWWD
jgi:hypothetical protein